MYLKYVFETDEQHQLFYRLDDYKKVVGNRQFSSQESL